MMRGGTIFWMALAVMAGIGLFLLKYEVAEMEDQLADINRETLINLEAVHVLKAEWSYLNRPQRLETLGRDLLSLEPVKARQTLDISDIPLRPDSAAEIPAATATPAADHLPPSRQIQARPMIGRHPIPPRRTSLEQPVPPAVETGRSRLLIAGAVFAVAFAVVAGRLVDVTLFADGNEPRLAQSTGETSHHTDRADIVDRNGFCWRQA